MRSSVALALVAVLLAAAAISTVDLLARSSRTIAVYATPALRPLLEDDLIPRFRNETDERVEVVYVAAGQQYNRLRLSGERPEADVFLHASPFHIEKGHAEGRFAPFRIEPDEPARTWRAFAWSPLVVVHPSGTPAPDLATPPPGFGIPDPLLSNNGIYAVLWFEALDPAAGARAIAQATLQPANAAATIGGVTDGSFSATLGYEAVALLYQAKGAAIAFDLPRLHGQAAHLPVLMTAGLVADHPHPDAQTFLRFLFTDETQSRLARHHLRAVAPGHAAPAGALDVEGAPGVDVDWSDWRRIEDRLDAYVVRP